MQSRTLSDKMATVPFGVEVAATSGGAAKDKKRKSGKATADKSGNKSPRNR